MRLSVSLAAIVAVPAVLLGGATPALAQAKAPPVYVLTPDSYDADEQAEALAVAIRSHVRETAGPGALGETPSSLDAFQQALRCPSYSEPACLDKIAAQLHTNRLVWGRLTRGGGKINATLHYYVKGRPDHAEQATYSENLRDANDESLRAVAAALYDKLSGISTSGTVQIHVAETAQGSVYVDGERRARLDRGGARVTLTLGRHTVEVRSTGFDPVRQTFEIHGGEDAIFEPRLLPAGTTVTDTDSGPPTRHIVGWGALGLGVVAGVVSGLYAAKYASDASDAKTDRSTYIGNATCGDHLSASVAACNDRSNGQRDSAIAWTFGGVGGALLVTGAVLLLTGSPDEGKTAAAAPASASMKLAPTFGWNAGGLSFSGRF
jgi:hypothetical protein